MGDVGSIGIPWPLKVREFSHEKWWIFPVRYANVYQRVSPSFPNFGMYRDIMGRSCGKPKKKTPAVDHPGRGIPNSLSTSVGGFFMAVHIGISCGDTAMSWNGKQNTCWLVVYLPL
jgi:hypothetical protein